MTCYSGVVSFVGVAGGDVEASWVGDTGGPHVEFIDPTPDPDGFAVWQSLGDPLIDFTLRVTGIDTSATSITSALTHDGPTPPDIGAYKDIGGGTTLFSTSIGAPVDETVLLSDFVVVFGPNTFVVAGFMLAPSGLSIGETASYAVELCPIVSDTWHVGVGRSW